MRNISTLKQSLAIAALTLSLAACEQVPVGYDIDVQQGNIIQQDSVNQLKIGMTREQVVGIMGEPIMVNTFDTRSWDYVYTSVSRKKHFVKNKVTLIFEQNQVVKILR